MMMTLHRPTDWSKVLTCSHFGKGCMVHVNGKNILLTMTSMPTRKLPLETDPIAHDNNNTS